MEIYVQSLDYGLWDIIRRGPYIPKREILRMMVQGVCIPKWKKSSQMMTMQD